MSPSSTTELPMRIPAAVKKLNVSISTVRRLIRDHQLHAFKIRGQWFLRDTDLASYEKSQRLAHGGLSQ